MIRLGLVKHRVGETIDPAELRQLAADGVSLNRAAQFLGIHWSTAERAARAHRIMFPRRFGGYGWHGVERSR